MTESPTPSQNPPSSADPGAADAQPGMYRPVPPQVDLADVDHEVIDFWERNRIFSQSLAQTADGDPWTFYEGPPTANGMPGTHHIEARSFKDIFPRFKTMQGFRVDRKAGWDCHGLPVELAVEKELGFSGKPDIEEYGVEPFNEKCRTSVTRYVDAWTELTRRMGYWVNLDEAYWTMDPAYVQSEWWALKEIHSRGLLVEDYRVAPYCPRCGTTLSDHELAQGYEDVTEPSIYVKFPLTSGPWAGKADLLVWTTTPWTLVSNTAVAVHPDVTYRVASREGEHVVVAEPLAEKVLGDEWTLGASFVGREMERWTYQRPLELVEFPPTDGGVNYVILADYVTTADGTGLVHQAPAFGEDDMLSCRAYGLPFVNPIRKDGTFDPALDLVGGLFFKTADEVVIDDLRARGLLFRVQDYEHSYPHCWRCHTALLYYAQPSWYIRTTAIKDQLLAENEKTNWYPDHIKHGRYGDWLTNNVDWDLSRTRYWGTPLPIWRCEDDHQVCVGSIAELGELAGRDLATLDPHRPFVDEVVFDCPTCGKESRRVPEVIDAWFDSGSMPFAQWGYPWKEGSKEAFTQHFPADFICEAIDQTRGWFYSQMAVSTLLFGQSDFKNVLCLGHILAEDGRKMSKHLGNILEPIPLLERHGADAVRWFMVASGSPWSARRVGHNALQEIVRKVLLTYWNTVGFHVLYARAAGWTPASAAGVQPTHVLDRWLASETNRLVGEVTEALEGFDTQRAGQQLADFIDVLSNWYVRRSRRRFWDGDPGALITLHTTLNVLTRLMAPIAPFITERVWQDLFAHTEEGAAASVHLAAWPAFDPEATDAGLDAAMDTARRLVELGRSARSEAQVKTRQPLSRVLVSGQSLARLNDELIDEVRAELNVVAVESFASAGDVVDYSAKANFRSLGKRFGKQTPTVAAAIAGADAAELAEQLRATDSATVVVDGVGEVVIGLDDVIVSERPREGWSVVNAQGETVALDLELTPELVSDGLAREVMRFVQETRKNTGLEVTDRISLMWDADPDVAAAIEAHADQIAAEVLATAMSRGSEGADWARDDDLGLAVQVAKAG